MPAQLLAVRTPPSSSRPSKRDSVGAKGSGELDIPVARRSPLAKPQRVTFGVAVELEDEDGRTWHFRLVGEDEADAERGELSWVSPLAKALLGAKPGDEVPWPRPAGVVMATVVALRT